MQILGSTVAVTIFSGIGQRQPLPELVVMVLFGLALLGISAIIRWRTRT
jgi:hypothetical protein